MNIRRFKGNDANEIRDGITFDFYLGLSHIHTCMYSCMYTHRLIAVFSPHLINLLKKVYLVKPGTIHPYLWPHTPVYEANIPLVFSPYPCSQAAHCFTVWFTFTIIHTLCLQVSLLPAGSFDHTNVLTSSGVLKQMT